MTRADSWKTGQRGRRRRAGEDLPGGGHPDPRVARGRLGGVGLAEEAVQDAFVEALEHWRATGAPPNPGGWLATTARRKAIDRLRRERAGNEKLALLAAIQPPAPGPSSEPGYGAGQREADELLGLIFACCHPLLSRDSQITLTLRVVCGLTTAEIAAAFLAGEPAMAQRLSRARKALREAGPAVRVPGPDQLGGRLDEVLAVIYLLFNEGYLASAGRTPARRDQAPISDIHDSRSASCSCWPASVIAPSIKYFIVRLHGLDPGPRWPAHTRSHERAGRCSDITLPRSA